EALRFAQEQITVVIQRKVKTSQDLFLCLSVEIHQGVPAHDQIQVGIGRVVDHVMVAEYNQGTRIRSEPAEPIASIARFEIFPPQVDRHCEKLLGGVTSPAGLDQSDVVNVRSKYRHTVVKSLVAHNFSQNHRNGVNLFTGSATRAPDAD